MCNYEVFPSVPNMCSPQRRKDKENSLFFFRVPSAPQRLCGEKRASANNMSGTEKYSQWRSLQVTALILAGGLGMRLRSVIADRPKVLATIHGRPFLTYLLDQLAEAGINTTVLCTGYMGELVQTTIGHSYRGMSVRYSQEASPLGTGGALRCAMPYLASDPVFVMNGDSYCKADLRKFAAWHAGHQAEATLLLTEVLDTSRYGRVEVDELGHIQSFHEKGDQQGPDWINAGVYLLSRRILLSIPEGQAVSLERDIFPVWIGHGLYGYQTESEFLDIGTPESYAEAERFFEEN